jgi:hypothetical protein
MITVNSSQADLILEQYREYDAWRSAMRINDTKKTMTAWQRYLKASERRRGLKAGFIGQRLSPSPR